MEFLLPCCEGAGVRGLTEIFLVRGIEIDDRATVRNCDRGRTPLRINTDFAPKAALYSQPYRFRTLSRAMPVVSRWSRLARLYLSSPLAGGPVKLRTFEAMFRDSENSCSSTEEDPNGAVDAEIQSIASQMTRRVS
jgi:hypothetical protein